MNEYEILDLAEALQKDCHRHVEVTFNFSKSSKITVQDAINVWLFRKLAELQIKIDEVASQNGDIK